MIVSLMKGVDPHVTPKDWSWEQFCEAAKQQSIRKEVETDDTKKSAVSFAFCEFKPAYRRLDNLVEKSTSAVVLDLDAVFSPRQVGTLIAQWKHIAWTTWSSQPGAEKWRVVIPLKRTVDRTKLMRIVHWFSQRLAGLAKVDPASRDAAHLWFFPWHRASNSDHHRVWSGDGKLYGGSTLSVDFTDTPSTRPERVESGGRNIALHRYLGERAGLECQSYEDLLGVAKEWNARLREPMPKMEVREVARKKWHWMNNDTHGIEQRRRVLGRTEGGITESELEGWSLTPRTVVPRAVPLIGDIIYPGCTLLTAKLKEGKSFLAAQLAFAMASGQTFLNGAGFPGFAIKNPAKSVLVAAEDTRSTMANRLHGNIKHGYLPAVTGGDVKIMFQNHLLAIRDNHPRMEGCALLEMMIDGWYRTGVRMILLDPLRVVEASLGIVVYPRVSREMNIHSKEFLSIVYYNQLAEKYRDLSIVVSLHHGKNKRDHDTSDPADMIAGTSGLLAGAMTMMALLPYGKSAADLAWQEGPKRRELYIHGRMTRERRLMVEQNERTGLWECRGDVREMAINETRIAYFTAMRDLGGMERWVAGDEISRRLGRKPETIHAVMGRMIRAGSMLDGMKIIAARSKGYRLVTG